MEPLIIPETSTRGLLAAQREIIAELKERGVVRTSNAPTGDYAEHLIAAHTEGTLAPNSEKSWDVLSPDHRRLQVKARVQTGRGNRGERQLSAIRSWDFDLLAIVLFADDYSVLRAVLVPTAVAQSSSTFSRHVNAWRLMATDDLLERPEAVDITEGLRATATAL